jgi:hypothetical protein
MAGRDAPKTAASRGKNQPGGWKLFPFLLYGVLFFCLGLLFLLAGPFFYFFLKTMRLIPGWVAWNDFSFLTGGILAWLGVLLAIVDLFVLLPDKRRQRPITVFQPKVRDLTVVLTAYNDELSIREAVLDFLGHPLVRRVIVVDNNSRDETAKKAAAAGAIVIREEKQGYGHCVYRALKEGMTRPDTDLTLLCEGDMSFRAKDIDKFMAYISHAEIVNGTRIVEQLRSQVTQLTTFMYYGNFFVGKLLEAKHIGCGTFTDVGTTYKLCHNSALRNLLPLLSPGINLEFNAHFLDTALKHGFRLLECPITFHNRLGLSKGGNKDNATAFRVGMRMIRGILFSWRRSF